MYRDFDPAILALIKNVDHDAVKVWRLMDMEKLPTWVSGKLALLGDAAHPFTPRTFTAVYYFDRRHEADMSFKTRARELVRPLRTPPHYQLCYPRAQRPMRFQND